MKVWIFKYSLFLDLGSNRLPFLLSQDWSVSADTSSGTSAGFAAAPCNSLSDCSPLGGSSVLAISSCSWFSS